jgi:hypothetical protein
MGLAKLNGAVWSSVVVDGDHDLDRIAHVLDDCGLNVERHEDGVFLNSDDGQMVLQFRVEEPRMTKWDLLNA